MAMTDYIDIETTVKKALCLMLPPCQHGEGCYAADDELVARCVKMVEKALVATPDQLEQARRDGYDEGESSCEAEIEGLECDVKEARAEVGRLQKEVTRLEGELRAHGCCSYNSDA